MIKKILLSLILLGTLLNATPPSEATVTRLYIATFDRAPDSAGLNYWLNDSELDLEGIALSFFEQEETIEKYPSSSSNADFIQAIYKNLFARTADTDGFEYWNDELDSDKMKRSIFILAVINGALGDDAKILANKLIVGLAFVEANRDDVAEAKKIMLTITVDSATVNHTLCNHTLTGCKVEEVDGFVGNPHEVSNEVIATQRTVLTTSIVGHDVGAQAPRDIDFTRGSNAKATTTAPASTAMNLCDIHFHKSAEHKGGQFTKYAGNGDGHGYGGGYKYSGTLTEAELSTFEIADEHNPLYSGDTIEVHYVYSSNPDATLGNGLGTCLTAWPEGTQPLLRVEAQVYVLVNDEHALNFETLNHVSKIDGRNQAENIPSNTGVAVHYEGSTTGPGYNEKVSPLQVTWNVRPNIAKVNIVTVEDWFHHNDFDEHHAHAVRNLVLNPDLLSEIK